MSNNHPHNSFDEQIRDQMSQLNPSVPEGVWEGLDAQLDSLNQGMQFDQAIRESMDKLHLSPPAGVFEAVQSQLGSLGSGLGSGLGLAGKWIIASIVGAGLTAGAVVFIQQNRDYEAPTVQMSDVNQPSSQSDALVTESSSIKDEEDTAESIHLKMEPGEVMPQVSSGQQNTPKSAKSQVSLNLSDENGIVPSSPKSNNTPAKSGTPPEVKQPEVHTELLNPLVGFTSHDTMLCMGQEYRLLLNQADACTYRVYLDGVLSATRKGNEDFRLPLSTVGVYRLDCQISRKEKVWKYTQMILVRPKPESRIEIRDLGKGLYEVQFPSNSQIDWTVDGNVQQDNQIQFYDPLPKDHLIQAKIENEYGCTSDANRTFRNNYVFKVSKPNIPNVFSPNGDGKNDVYRVEMEGSTYFRMIIFNQNSQLVYESNDPDDSWNGRDKNRGNEVIPGIYTCIVEYALAGGEIMKEQILVKLILD
ncbi:MAG: hypothetical protein GC180_08845 [Bacteroidetes bacterium]|nr:hypothetical protein [Bacteroidota bacterium]